VVAAGLRTSLSFCLATRRYGSGAAESRRPCALRSLRDWGAGGGGGWATGRAARLGVHPGPHRGQPGHVPHPADAAGGRRGRGSRTGVTGVTGVTGTSC
jgi:hypothetical protein